MPCEKVPHSFSLQVLGFGEAWGSFFISRVGEMPGQEPGAPHGALRGPVGTPSVQPP